MNTERAAALAARLESGANALADFAEALSDADWQLPVPGDQRAIGVIVHHVASVYPLEVQLAMAVASGKPITDVTMADVHAMNARHAREHAHVAQADAIRLLRTNSAAAAVAIRGLSDQQLARAAAVSLYADAPLTSQFVLEDHAVRHSYHHLAAIRRALAVMTP